MIVDFNQRESDESEISFARTYELGEIDLNDEIAQVAGPLTIKGTARQTAGGASVTGDLESQLKVACDRCLQPLEVAIRTSFNADYVTLNVYEQAQLSNVEHELTQNDLSLSIYDGEHIDLDELIREQILLNLPAKQLCRENCAGLCEKCGANKNTNNCACETTEIDPRWSALKELKIKS